MEDVAEKAEQQEEKKAQKDDSYWQQQVHQRDVNFQKERDKRESVERQMGETQTQLEVANSKLKELETQLRQKSEYKQMDRDIVDPAVAGNIEVLQKQIEELTKTQAQQQNKISEYEQLEQRREQDRQYEQAVDNICAPLDEQYGKKYRSEARSLADKAVESGEEPKPNTTLEAYLLIEKFYKQLSEKEAKKPKPAATDNGKGSVPVAKGRDAPGTFADVLSEMKAKCKT